MMDTEMYLVNLARKAEKLFVQNGADLHDPRVMAAITAAAGGMAMAGDIVSKHDAYDAILAALVSLSDENLNYESYEAVLASLQDEKYRSIYALVEQMTPDYVKSAIGFATDFFDYGAAVSAYNSQRGMYDELFNRIKYLNQSKGKTL